MSFLPVAPNKTNVQPRPPSPAGTIDPLLDIHNNQFAPLIGEGLGCILEVLLMSGIPELAPLAAGSSVGLTFAIGIFVGFITAFVGDELLMMIKDGYEASGVGE